MDQEKLQRMQFLEQNLQAIYMQKQAFQMELDETLSSIKEVEKTNEPVYKLIGQLMIKVDSSKVLDELKNKERLINLRIKALDDQQKSFEEQVTKFRDDLVNSQKE